MRRSGKGHDGRERPSPGYQVRCWPHDTSRIRFALAVNAVWMSSERRRFRWVNSTDLRLRVLLAAIMANWFSVKGLVYVGLGWVLIPACGSSSPSQATSADRKDAGGISQRLDAGGGLIDGAVSTKDTGSLPTKPGDAAPTATEACVAFIEAHCGYLARCSPKGLRFYFDTEEQCRQVQMPICMDRFVAQGTGLDPTGLWACTREVAGTTCVSSFNGKLPACTFHGTVATGLPCRYGDQCQSGLCRYPNWFDKCGVCAPRGQAGQACNQLDGCDVGMDCSSGPAPRDVCIRTKPHGASCDRNKDLCVYPSVCSGGVCGSLPGVGQACDEGACNPTQDIDCDGATCRRLSWNRVGEACGQTPVDRCVADLECQNNMCITGTYVRTYPRAAECR